MKCKEASNTNGNATLYYGNATLYYGNATLCYTVFVSHDCRDRKVDL